MAVCPICGHRPTEAAGDAARDALARGAASTPWSLAGLDLGGAVSGAGDGAFAAAARGGEPWLGMESADLDAASASASTPIYVDANVLACCNGAYDRAELARADEVRLADVLHVAAGTPTLEAWLAAYDIDRDLLRIEIEGYEDARDFRGGSLDPPVTSVAMRGVLQAARERARRRLSTTVGIGDVLAAILADAQDDGARLLADHVERQRQRRRRGMRGARAGIDETARGPGLALSDGPERAWGGDGDLTPRTAFDGDVADHSGAMSLTDMHRSDVGGDAAVQADALGGHRWPGRDDLYRPGEHEPSDGGHRPPSWSHSEFRPRNEIADNAAMTEGWAARAVQDSAAAIEALSARLADWQARLSARLDEQGRQLEALSIRSTAAWDDRHITREGDGAAKDGAAQDGNGERAVTDVTPTPGLMMPRASAQNQSAARGQEAGSSTATKATFAATSSSMSTASIGRAVGGGKRRHLERSSIRASMQRTLSRRRRTRAALQKAARDEATAKARLEAQLQATKAVEEAAVAERRARSDMRMATPPGASRGEGRGEGRAEGRPRFKADHNGGYLRPQLSATPSDDEDGDDIDGSPQKRFFLSLDDDIVQAPSIGPRTAERLREHGVSTVRDLLTVKPAALSARVNTRHITAERVTSWQHQARLVCTIPWLRGTHAQILVGSGYYAPHSIVSANRDALCTAILRFATTREGQSVLRSAPPPSLGKIMRWVEQAAMAELDRAA